MAGLQKDPELCRQYAQFASHMLRWQFKIIYWTLFVANLLVLFVASWAYIKGQHALEKYLPHTQKRAQTLRKYIFVCLGCVATSIVIVVMQAYALLALQFCDGEYLMPLYWSTWTMTQVGSLIAMVGIILALLNSLRNRKHPPWALALGTPVLVIAGALHLFHDCTKKRVKKIRQRCSRGSEEGPPMSQADTIRSPEEGDIESAEVESVEFIGFTVDKGPIVRFINPQLASTFGAFDDGEILGYCGDNRPVVAYRKGSITFVSDFEAAATKEGHSTVA